MATHAAVAESPEERLITIALVGGWFWYALGALYVVGPALAAGLLAIYGWRRYTRPIQTAGRMPPPVPFSVWIWIVCMLGMLFSLFVAHAEWELGAAQTLKSAIGWIKGWGLFAIFPLAGACLSIRPAIVIRAVGRFSLQTLILLPLLIAAPHLGLPSRLFISPLQVIGGPGPEFFSVYLYTIDPADGSFRWQFIAPWAPGAGMLGNLIFLLALRDADRRWRWIGIAAAIAISLMTKSRMAVLFLLFAPPAVWGLSRMVRPSTYIGAAAATFVAGLSAGWISQTISDAISGFRAARASSSRVREALGRIAVERWRSEAPIFGHGIVERGPHYVEFMPIGSHHTWYGLLYVKGLLGVASAGLALLWSFAEMVLLSQKTELGKLGLSIVLLLVFYSGGENLEILAYLIWPGLLLLGTAFAQASGSELEAHNLP